MTANKPMTAEQLDELMTVAVNMQRDAETDCNRPCAMFAYAVQVAVLELRKVRNDAEALAAENAGLKTQLLEIFNSCDTGERRGNGSLSGAAVPDWCVLEKTRQFLESTPATSAFLAEVRASGVKSLSNAVQSVISERQRQQSVEGWTPEHDDQYGESQLLWASSCYVLNTIHSFNRIPLDWPWAPEWWKPTNPRRDLVKAGALILAEIERIDRQEAAQ
ncbi:hypothetical protein F859_gp33 [Enterobacteria phage mEp390]|uniref:hypothetical protein n=1 Tax=Enterobacteria phage mEp390 TaxID=1147158 RepID=UPI00029D3E8B|nr:hypothetical protein F859_gp33 [Enterobacteria phage mEp390]AFM76129.1 hypothetical protein mEp390_033 [Enterobacteria phage mEp390]